jgi:hypothetical protein
MATATSGAELLISSGFDAPANPAEFHPVYKLSRITMVAC